MSSRINYGVVVHGGAGTPGNLEELHKLCERAGNKALSIVEQGGEAVDASVEAVKILEDDGRVDAGYGSYTRMDGQTVEMDSALMSSKGDLASVIALQGFKNPILLAKELSKTPHIAIAGEGARIFAQKLQLEKLDEISPKARKRSDKIIQMIKAGKIKSANPLWEQDQVSGLWNFAKLKYEDVYSPDTVGVVVLDKSGVFAVATSTGGASPMMMGRVGDTPMVGCGFYAGERGAVAVTGIGEEAVRRMSAKTVYDKFASMSPDLAVQRGVEDFPKGTECGIIAITHNGAHSFTNAPMPFWSFVG